MIDELEETPERLRRTIEVIQRGEAQAEQAKKELVEAMREAAKPAPWSSGVKLAHDSAAETTHNMIPPRAGAGCDRAAAMISFTDGSDRRALFARGAGLEQYRRSGRPGRAR